MALMITPIDLIGEHTATGASTKVHALGRDRSGKGDGVASLRRIIQVTGIAGGSVIKIQWSLDLSNWKDLIEITADDGYVLEDGIRYIRSNCTTYGSGTVRVYAQKFVEEE
jgi:hypothetical protein